MTKLWNNGQRCKNVTCDKKSKWIGINWPGSMNTLKGKGRKASLITNKGKTSIRYATIKQDYHCRPFRSKARKPTFYISSWTSEHETHACRKSFQDLKFQSSSRRFFAFGVSGSGEFPNEVTSENKRCKVWIRAKLRLQKSKPWEWDGGMRKRKKKKSIWGMYVLWFLDSSNQLDLGSSVRWKILIEDHGLLGNLSILR